MTTEKEKNKVIEQTAKSTAKAVISELKQQGLVKTKKSPFQKTETILYDYNNYLDAINDKYEQIEEIRAEGMPKKSTSVSIYSSHSSFDSRSEDEKSLEKIEDIEKSIIVTKALVSSIEAVLEGLKKDKYYKIIEMKYFEGKKRDEIVEYFGVDASTINRNKNRLIKILQIRLFSDETILEMFK